jgi:putative methyltransferase (TIGR04325 family)
MFPTISKAKSLTPPALYPYIRRFLGVGNTYSGNYKEWSAACSSSSGYESGNILDRVLSATLKVFHGEAPFERDSVSFQEIKYDWPVTAALMLAASRSRGNLKVLDYGGALGSSFFQNREFIKNLDVLWSIVEQKNFVAAGTEFIKDDRLRFFESICECCAETQPNVALISCALQYLADPYDVIRQIESTRADIMILNRTPFFDGQNDRICVQNVPSSIYKASYPVWIFSKQGFLSKLKDWSLVATFECDEGVFLLDDFKCVQFLGIILERKNAQYA